MIAINFGAIPEELHEGKHHCNWRAVLDPATGKIGKKPWDAEKLCGLTWSNPLKLITFDEAVTRYEEGLDKPEQDAWHFGGIGYIIPEDSELACIDLDDKLEPVLDEAGKPTPKAQVILERLNSYSEVSPSGKGIHIWIKAHVDGASIPETNFNSISVEMFVRKHHVTLTGLVIPGFEALEGRQAEAQAFYDELKSINSKPPGEKDRGKCKTTTIGNDVGSDRKRKYCLSALEDECQILASTSFFDDLYQVFKKHFKPPAVKECTEALLCRQIRGIQKQQQEINKLRDDLAGMTRSIKADSPIFQELDKLAKLAPKDKSNFDRTGYDGHDDSMFG